MSGNGSNEANDDGWTFVYVAKSKNPPQSKSRVKGSSNNKAKSGKNTNAKKGNPHQQSKNPDSSNVKKNAGKVGNQPQPRKRKPTAAIQLGDLAPGLKQGSKKNKKKNNNQQQSKPKPSILKKCNEVRSQPEQSFNPSEFPTLGGRPKPLSTGLNPAASPWQLQSPPQPNTIHSTTTQESTAKPPPPKEMKQGSIAPWAQVVPAAAAPMPIKLEDVANTQLASNKPNKKVPPKAKGPAPTKSKNQGSADIKNKKNSSDKNVKTTVKVKPTASIADMFAAKPRLDDRGNGDELQLMRLMMDGKVASANTGRGHRQRVRPRKKKFSALKKKVLKERLLKWQELHPPESPDESTNDHNIEQTSRTICVWGFAEAEIVDDEDEHEELVNNLRDMALGVAPSESIFIPRSIPNTASEKGHPAFVRFPDTRSVEAALSCWDGLNLGGQKLQVSRVKIVDDSSLPEDDNERDESTRWENHCLEWMNRSDSHDSDDENAQVIIENVLTEDDLDDEDCLEESLHDIRTIAENHGQIADIEADKDTKSVIVTYEGGSQAAKRAAESLGKTVIGGSAVVARLKSSSDSISATCHIILKNALSEEDLEDEDCLEESLGDLKELAESYAPVVSLILVDEANVKIEFLGALSVAQTAAAGFHGMVMGGASIEAVLPGTDGEPMDMLKGTSSSQNETSLENGAKQNNDNESGPLYSGDKLIGKQWAECKRTPKVPNAAFPRSYAALLGDDDDKDRAKELLIEMLGELMRLQKRAAEEDRKNNTNKAKRRIVMGLREVAKGIRTHKIKMVVMANNLDDYGVIDAKLQEILDLAHEGGIPVFFEFSKRGLGKAIGRSIKVAVVG